MSCSAPRSSMSDLVRVWVAKFRAPDRSTKKTTLQTPFLFSSVLIVSKFLFPTFSLVFPICLSPFSLILVFWFR